MFPMYVMCWRPLVCARFLTSPTCLSGEWATKATFLGCCKFINDHNAAEEIRDMTNPKVIIVTGAVRPQSDHLPPVETDVYIPSRTEASAARSAISSSPDPKSHP